MSKSGGGHADRQTQSSQTGVDPATMAYMKKMWDAAQAAGQAGPSPLLTGASDYNTGMMGAGARGVAALGGDADATKALMNPYQQQVIGAANQQWDQNDAYTQNAANDAATKAGAFGGGRHGVMAGVAQGQNNMNRNSQISGLLSSGFDNTMNRAGMLAQGGFQGAQANANLGMGGVGSPQQWLLEMMKKGFMGPTGTTSSGSGSQVGAQTQFSTNPFA